MNNLSDLIPEANKVRSETNQNTRHMRLVKSNIEYLNNRISEAKNQGKTSIHFSVDESIKEEVRQLYIDKGYMFRPTGYIGVVWQHTENICW